MSLLRLPERLFMLYANGCHMSAGPDDSVGSKEEILEGTYRALCKNGFAALTMADVAEEIGKSRSLIHYHFGTREELILAYIDRMTGWVAAAIEESEIEHPVDRLAEFLDFFIVDPAHQRESLGLAILELRVQSIHNPEIREKMRQHYGENAATIAAIIAEGIESGEFDANVDPNQVGEAMYTAMVGARTYQFTLNPGPASEAMGRYLWTIATEMLFTDVGRERLHAPDFPEIEIEALF